MAPKRKKAVGINDRLEGIEGTLDDFNKLLTNHITEYTKEFGEVKAQVKVLTKGFEGYKWLIVTILGLVTLSLGGFVTLAVYAVLKLISM